MHCSPSNRKRGDYSPALGKWTQQTVNGSYTFIGKICYAQEPVCGGATYVFQKRSDRFAAAQL